MRIIRDHYSLWDGVESTVMYGPIEYVVNLKSLLVWIRKSETTGQREERGVIMVVTLSYCGYVYHTVSMCTGHENGRSIKHRTAL
jgi:hypothetical protein